MVVISPGHGWWSASAGAIDPGDSGAGLVEKDVTLAVARQAQELLARCPVEVVLTRETDDEERTLAGVHEVVNAQAPRLAVALHVGEAGAPSGALGWHTVGGWDDEGSRRLAGRLAGAVAARLGLADRGALPETASAGGGLYIHPWQAPAALVDLGSLGADSESLRGRGRDFARAVAEAVLDELGLPKACADAAAVRGWPAAVAFPEEAVSASLTLVNDGLQPWDPALVWLEAAGETYGAASRYALPALVAPGEAATWAIPARAPTGAGIHEQRWQLMTWGPSGEAVPVGVPAAVVLVVAPPEAQALREKLDRQTAEWKAAGQAKAEEMVEEMKGEIAAWARAEAERQVVRCVGMNGAVALALAGVCGLGERRRTKRA
jgi:hypothetical protein